MKKIKKIIKKTLLISLISLEIILINIQPAQAILGSLLGGILGSDGSSSPNANGMLEQMETRYHLNKDSIKNFGETFNVADQKNPAPEVDIFFTPTNPKLGEKITATAMPKYFQEGVENQYFTWYIKHIGCDESDSVGSGSEHCDVDDDGDIDTNDWKIEAMRLVANSGFIKEKSDYSQDETSIVNSVTNIANVGDGFSAHIGGRVNVQETDYCYIHNFNTGENYEIATADEDDNDDEDGFECYEDDGVTKGTVMCTSPYTLSCGFLEGTNSVPEYDMGDVTTTAGDTTTTTDGTTGDTTTTSTGGSSTSDLTSEAHDEEFEGTSIDSIEANTDSGYEPTCDTDKECPKDKCTTDELECPTDKPDCDDDEKECPSDKCTDDEKVHKVTCPEGTTSRCLKDDELALIDPKCDDDDTISALKSLDANDATIVGGLNGADVHPMFLECADDGRAFGRFDETGMSYCGNGGLLTSPPGGECTVTLDTDKYGLVTWTFTNPGGPSQGSSSCKTADPGCPGRYEDSGFVWKSVATKAPHTLGLFFPAKYSGCDESDPGETDITCTTTNYDDDDTDQTCEHQFPDVEINGTKYEIGDGDFGLEEENFWGTNPLDPSTADNTNNDEANVAGLGMDKLMWSYLPGDEVGVIVEGLSYLATKHDDSSNAISFALVNNIFDKSEDSDSDTTDTDTDSDTDSDTDTAADDIEEGECKITEAENYTEEIKDYDVEIPFATINIDNCLKYNLVAPTDGYQADNMDVTMDYSPKNPNAGSMGSDGSGESMGGDNLVVSTNTSDQNLDTNQIYYKWSIYGFSGERKDITLDKDSWILLSDDADFRKRNNVNLLEGLGMDSLEMKLNDIDDYDFLRFFVESEEFFDTGTGTTGTTRSGRSDIIVEPNISDSSSEIKIKSGNTEICRTAGPCEILNKQIINVELAANSTVSNYLWTLDGKEITAVNNNATKQDNNISFVLAGEPGDYHVLNVIANDTTSPGTSGGNTGAKLNVSRRFVITKPMVEIGSNNRINRGNGDCLDLNGQVDNSSILGTYKSVNGSNEIKDCRESVFNGSGNVTIVPTFYPDWIGSHLKNVKYYINGAEQDNGNIDLNAYPEGSLVNIAYVAEYWPSDTERVSLKKWGISETESGGIKLADSILVKVKNSGGGITKKASKIIAGLAYNIPEQMIFMFRMILTAVIIIFAAGIVMSLGQKKKYN